MECKNLISLHIPSFHFCMVDQAGRMCAKAVARVTTQQAAPRGTTFTWTGSWSGLSVLRVKYLA